MKPRVALVTIGHVDHGKSTLLGRLLVEKGVVPREEVARYERQASAMGLPTEGIYMDAYNRMHMGETVSGRLPDDLVRDLDELGKLTGKSRSEVLRGVVEKGVAAERLERGLEAYRRREASLGRASEMAGVPITVFLDELHRAGILRNYDLADLRHDLAWADRA